MIASSFKYSFRCAVAQSFVKVALCQVILLLQFPFSAHVGPNSHACPSVHVKYFRAITKFVNKSAGYKNMLLCYSDP
jgi:hypothetical protein